MLWYVSGRSVGAFAAFRTLNAAPTSEAQWLARFLLPALPKVASRFTQLERNLAALRETFGL